MAARCQSQEPDGVRRIAFQYLSLWQHRDGEQSSRWAFVKEIPLLPLHQRPRSAGVTPAAPVLEPLP